MTESVFDTNISYASLFGTHRRANLHSNKMIILIYFHIKNYMQLNDTAGYWASSSLSLFRVGEQLDFLAVSAEYALHAKTMQSGQKDVQGSLRGYWKFCPHLKPKFTQKVHETLASNSNINSKINILILYSQTNDKKILIYLANKLILQITLLKKQKTIYIYRVFFQIILLQSHLGLT